VEFANWNGGVLPPEGQGFNDALATGSVWQFGSGSSTFLSIQDTVIDSRTHPKYVALPQFAGSVANGGICVLNAADGSVVTVTNGARIQSLTNIDFANEYSCAAWDNVGNLYAASTSTNYWRVWSPPGANTNTTLAVAQLVVQPPFSITSISATPTTPGCASVTIKFTNPGTLAPSSFKVYGSASVKGPYAAVAATITGGSGTHQATFSNCSTEFYVIEH
jgi:hypothetical protein